MIMRRRWEMVWAKGITGQSEYSFWTLATRVLCAIDCERWRAIRESAYRCEPPSAARS